MPRITVDGIDYVPAGDQPLIGVGITTKDRPQVCTDTVEAFRRLSPGIPIVVVDEGSSHPSTDGCLTVRHETPLGIPRAKNRCITELMRLGVQHLFLFDDDTKPCSEQWWKPYVQSPEPHLQHSWTHFHNGKAVTRMSTLYAGADLMAYGWSMGCMLYTERRVIDRVGGMREEFSPAMHEHIEWSRRIHQAGFTTFTHQDVPFSDTLIWAADRFKAVQSSIGLTDRKAQLERNDRLLDLFDGCTDFVPYGHRDIVLSCLFTSQPDPQRGQRMPSDPGLADRLAGSLNTELVVLCDFDTDRAGFVRTDTHLSPYIQRWVSYRRYLLTHPEIRFVWCVDATDVESLQPPFDRVEAGVLYCGWENQIVGCDWMRQHHPATTPWIEANRNRTLLNAGVVGGDRDTMLRFTATLLRLWAENPADQSDMGYFNQAAYAMDPMTGPPITTVFKTNQPNQWSLWKHK